MALFIWENTVKPLIAWAQQPTSVAGLATLFGTFSALMTHQLSWAQALPLLAGAFTSIALPDNTQAKRDAEALAQDVAAYGVAGKAAFDVAQAASASRS
jgi:hypothetical protein